MNAQPRLIHTALRLTPADRARAREIANGADDEIMGLCAEWCEICGVTMDEIRDPGRQRRLVHARWGLAFILRYTARLPRAQVGKIVNLDSTGVEYAVRQEAKRRAQ